MNIHYLISHMRNAQNSNFGNFSIKKSSTILRILELLTINGYISSFKEEKDKIQVYLKYPLLDKINMQLVSKPGKKVYMDYPSIIRSFHKNDFLLISTKQGIITSKEVLVLKIGGEILLQIKN